MLLNKPASFVSSLVSALVLDRQHSNEKINVRCYNLTHEIMADEVMAALIRTLLPAKLKFTQSDPNIFVCD